MCLGLIRSPRACAPPSFRPSTPSLENAKCLRRIALLSLQRERAGFRISSGCRRRRPPERNAALKIERRVMLVKTDRGQMIPLGAKLLLLKSLLPKLLQMAARGPVVCGCSHAEVRWGCTKCWGRISGRFRQKFVHLSAQFVFFATAGSFLVLTLPAELKMFVPPKDGNLNRMMSG